MDATALQISSFPFFVIPCQFLSKTNVFKKHNNKIIWWKYNIELYSIEESQGKTLFSTKTRFPYKVNFPDPTRILNFPHGHPVLLVTY